MRMNEKISFILIHSPFFNFFYSFSLFQFFFQKVEKRENAFILHFPFFPKKTKKRENELFHCVFLPFPSMFFPKRKKEKVRMNEKEGDFLIHSNFFQFFDFMHPVLGGPTL